MFHSFVAIVRDDEIIIYPCTITENTDKSTGIYCFAEINYVIKNKWGTQPCIPTPVGIIRLFSIREELISTIEIP